MQHPEWFLNTIEPRLWAVTGLDHGAWRCTFVVSDNSEPLIIWHPNIWQRSSHVHIL